MLGTSLQDKNGLQFIAQALRNAGYVGTNYLVELFGGPDIRLTPGTMAPNIYVGTLTLRKNETITPAEMSETVAALMSEGMAF